MPDADAYQGREQTQAKHFILRKYLERLAFKILSFSELTYVDGFSGPWETTTKNFSDSSFMIALEVLKSAQSKLIEQKGKCRRIRCFFSEVNKASYEQLRTAVASYHRPDQGFEVCTFHGEFENAVADIQRYVGRSFALIFIDPTGWTGYPFEKIKPLFAPRKCEVLVNFMYAFIYRFIHSNDDDIINSLNPILGGAGWRERLDPTLPRGVAVERLFRESLKEVGKFNFVVSTKIDKATAECPHFYIAYGTKSSNGLVTYRNTEYETLRVQARTRASAKEKQREDRWLTSDMFAGQSPDVQESAIDELVRQQKIAATNRLLDELTKKRAMRFSEVVALLLEEFIIRETDVKDICVALQRSGTLQRTWGPGGAKPRDTGLITLVSGAHLREAVGKNA